MDQRDSRDPGRTDVPVIEVTGVQALETAAALVASRGDALVAEGRLQEALELYRGEAEGFRRTLAGAGGQVSAAFAARARTFLARGLGEIGSLLLKLQRPEEALDATREALDLARQPAPGDRTAAHVLSRVLFTYGWVRAVLGVEREVVLPALAESERIVLGLLRDAPGAQTRELQGDLEHGRRFRAALLDRGWR